MNGSAMVLGMVICAFGLQDCRIAGLQHDAKRGQASGWRS